MLEDIVMGVLSYKCESCSHPLAVPSSEPLLLSNPPKFKYKCSNCGHIGYAVFTSYLGVQK